MRKMNERIRVLGLCVALGLSCAACGKSEKKEETTTAAPTTEAATTEAANAVSVDEQVIVDEKDYKLTVKSFGEFKTDMYMTDNALNIEVENRSDKKVEVCYYDSSVNGYMVGIDLAMEVEPGETTVVPAIFNEAELERSGIDTDSIGEMEFRVVIRDAENYEEYYTSDAITVRTSEADSYEDKYDKSGTFAYDEGGIKIVVQETVDDDFFGPQIKVYMENNTDKAVRIQSDEAEINGKKYETYCGLDVFPGKKGVGLLGPGVDEELKEEIKTYTGSFTIYDNVTGDAMEEHTDPVSVTFE